MFSFIFLIEGREEISKFLGRKIVINKIVKILGILYFEKNKNRNEIFSLKKTYKQNKVSKNNN